MNKAWTRAVDFFSRKKQSYQLTFGPSYGRVVIADLAKFCRAYDDCVVFNRDGSINTEQTFMLNGRREVWLHLQHYLNLPAEKLAEMQTVALTRLEEINDDNPTEPHR